MRLIKILKIIYKAKHPHFLSVDRKLYFRWGLTIGLFGCAVMFFVLGYLFSERLI